MPESICSIIYLLITCSDQSTFKKKTQSFSCQRILGVCKLGLTLPSVFYGISTPSSCATVTILSCWIPGGLWWVTYILGVSKICLLSTPCTQIPDGRGLLLSGQLMHFVMATVRPARRLSDFVVRFSLASYIYLVDTWFLWQLSSQNYTFRLPNEVLSGVYIGRQS